MVKTHILTDLQTENLTTENAKVKALEAEKIKVRNNNFAGQEQRENGGVKADSDIVTARKIVVHNDSDDQPGSDDTGVSVTYDNNEMVISGDVKITGKLTSTNQVVGDNSNGSTDALHVKENLLVGNFDESGERGSINANADAVITGKVQITGQDSRIEVVNDDENNFSKASMDTEGKVEAVGSKAEMKVSDNSTSMVKSSVDAESKSASIDVKADNSGSVKVSSENASASVSTNAQSAEQSVEYLNGEGDFFKVKATADASKAEISVGDENGSIKMTVNDMESKISGVDRIENMISTKNGVTRIHGSEVILGDNSINFGETGKSEWFVSSNGTLQSTTLKLSTYSLYVGPNGITDKLADPNDNTRLVTGVVTVEQGIVSPGTFYYGSISEQQGATLTINNVTPDIERPGLFKVTVEEDTSSIVPGMMLSQIFTDEHFHEHYNQGSILKIDGQELTVNNVFSSFFKSKCYGNRSDILSR